MSRGRLVSGLPWLLAGLLLLAGCAQLNLKQKPLRLEDALNAYTSALRWGHANTANSYLRSRDGTSLASDARFRKDLRVAQYQVTSRAPVSEDLVVVEAHLAYMSTATGTLEQLTDHQVWWYDAEDSRWYMEGEIPAVLLEPVNSDQ